MPDWVLWLSRPENGKPISLVIFVVVFFLVLVYIFGNRSRSKRLEAFGKLPLDDDHFDGKKDE